MPESADRQRPQTPFAQGSAPRLLVMDDEPSVLTVVKAALETLGYEVEVAADGGQAVERFGQARAQGRPFAAVILDLTVRRGAGGIEALDRLVRLDPGVRAIVTSGNTENPILHDHTRHGFAAVLAKPFRLYELRDAVRRVLGTTTPLNPADGRG